LHAAQPRQILAALALRALEDLRVDLGRVPRGLRRRWRVAVEPLLEHRVLTTEREREADEPDRRPAGTHCPNPSTSVAPD
jgi:hypothetical protein